MSVYGVFCVRNGSGSADEWTSVSPWCQAGCARSQLALNRLYTPEPFELSQRYGQMMCVLFYTIIFFVAAPPLFPIAALYAILTYNVDKVGRCRLRVEGLGFRV